MLPVVNLFAVAKVDNDITHPLLEELVAQRRVSPFWRDLIWRSDTCRKNFATLGEILSLVTSGWWAPVAPLDCGLQSYNRIAAKTGGRFQSVIQSDIGPGIKSMLGANQPLSVFDAQGYR
jgi:hypothetical protein